MLYWPGINNILSILFWFRLPPHQKSLFYNIIIVAIENDITELIMRFNWAYILEFNQNT